MSDAKLILHAKMCCFTDVYVKKSRCSVMTLTDKKPKFYDQANYCCFFFSF